MRSPVDRVKPCQFGSCPAGSMPFGQDPEHPDLNWVNTFAATAMDWGVEYFGPLLWDGEGPDLAVSGINFGENVWLGSVSSSTIAAAGWAVQNHDIPAIAFSGFNRDWRPYWAEPVLAQEIYAELASKVVNEVLSHPKPYLPPGVMLNVNFPRVRNACKTADQFRFVLTRVNADGLIDNDPSWCGSKDLPNEYALVDFGRGFNSMPCTVAISPMDARDKTTPNAHWKILEAAEAVAGILECPIDSWWESYNERWDNVNDWAEYVGKERPVSDRCNHKGDEEKECRRARGEVIA